MTNMRFCYIFFIGSHFAFALDDKGKFKYFFLAFDASIAGWRYCRPVISVDGTFLTNKFKETLLLATMLDVDNHVFPLALGVVDSENDASWTWFFEQLKCAIGDREELVIISDRNQCIPKAVSQVYPTALHGICVQHLYNNVHSKFKNGSIEPLFNRCARVYTMKEFVFYMDALHSINARIKEYLFLADPSKWARSQFERKRYNIMTTNISECLNGILKVARDRPIASVVEAYRKMLQKWFYERRNAGHELRSKLTIWAEVILQRQEEIARTLRVRYFPSKYYLYY